MIRTIQPKRVVEIGSGYSSAALLDINEREFGGRIEYVIVDPEPTLLLELVSTEHHDDNEFLLVAEEVQDVGGEQFAILEAGDVLFVDSTHVSKIDRDVNHLLFRILPLLQAGVYIHFHDIYYPFEYPPEWIFQGRAWNEAYLLRAFLAMQPLL